MTPQEFFQNLYKQVEASESIQNEYEMGADKAMKIKTAHKGDLLGHINALRVCADAPEDKWKLNQSMIHGSWGFVLKYKDKLDLSDLHDVPKFSKFMGE